MQGVVMLIGVLILLPLALTQVGGLEYATSRMAKMTPPVRVTATLERNGDSEEERTIRKGSWIVLRGTDEDDAEDQLYRTVTAFTIPAGKTSSDDVELLKLTTQADIEQVLGNKTIEPIENVAINETKTTTYKYGQEKPGSFVTGPGPSPKSDSGFLPLSLGISFFFMWAISGAGQPSNMVRLMAFNSSRTLRRSIFTVAIYYTLIYFPLVMIFCCARVLMPGMEAEPDRIMPAVAILLTENIGMGWLAGLLVAAPFAAAMSTVDSFLLMISSALVRDIYQRNIDPEASEKTIKRLSYLCTLLVGTAAMLGAVNPPKFLQDIIVYTGSGLSSCFLAPMVFGLYWPRVNKYGAISGMLAGFSAHLSMYVAGSFINGSFFSPYRVFNIDPILVGLFVSFITVYLVTKATPAPSEELVRRYFHKDGAKVTPPTA